MATLHLAGLESSDIQVEGATLTGTTPVFGSSYKRGSAGLGMQCIGTTKLAAGLTFSGSTLGMTANRSNWVRDSFYVKTAPDSGAYTAVAQWNFSAVTLEVRVLNTSGTLSIGIYKAGSVIGSTQTISTLTWYTLDTLVYVNSAGGGDDTVGMWIDDTQLANSTTQTLDTVVPVSYQSGQLTTIASGTQPEIWHDHLIFNDDQGASQNTRPDFYKVLGFFATSDNAVGANWERSSGNAARYSETDTVPPTYNTSASLYSAGTDAIHNRANDTTGDAKFNWPSYATAGATSGDTIKVIQLVASTGSNSGTDTSGAIKITDYGAGSGDSAEKSIVFDNGVASSAASTWRVHRTTPAYPSVTTAQNPVAYIGKRDTATRHAICNQLLLYFGYVTPAATGTPRTQAIFF